MGNQHVSLNDFKKRIDSFDEFFEKHLNDLKIINVEYDKELEKNKKTINDFGSKTLQENILTYEEMLKTINSLVKSLESSGISLKDCENPELVKYQNIDQAINGLNDNLSILQKAIDDLNKYGFEDSKASFSFDGENASVNDNSFTAPDFPDLSLNDFDTDNVYVEKTHVAYKQAKLVQDICEFVTSYLKSDNYEKYILDKVSKANTNADDEVNVEREGKTNELIEKDLTFYKNEIAPFLEENNRSLKDYLTLETLRPRKNFHKVINIGSTEYSFKNFDKYANKISDLDINKLVNKEITYPFTIDLSNKGNILINSNGTDENLVEFINQLILQYVSSMPTKKLNLALVDADERDIFDFDQSFSKNYLIDNKLIFADRVASDQTEFLDMVTKLNDKLRDIKREKLGPKNCSNVFEYNELSKENTQEMYLFVYPNCPKALNSNITEKLSNLLFNGNACGVFFIILNNTTIKLSDNSYEYNKQVHKDFMDMVASKSHVFTYDINKKEYEIEKEIFKPNYSFTGKDINEFFDRMKSFASKESKDQVISLKSLMSAPYEKEEYYNQLKIPVGKDGGQPVFFQLNISGEGSHAIIAGGTGSGKTAFLHTMILSGAYNYSPDELEFYLIDFKDGVEFRPYANKENGICIPHVSFLSVKNKVEDAYDILLKIENEFHKRSEWFGKTKEQCTNIMSYQSSPEVREGKFPSFKRIVVVIDEYQNFLSNTDSNVSALCAKCSDKLTYLLKLVRSHGISFVLSSQEISVEREALNQIANRYVFKSSSNVLSAAFPESFGDQCSIDLNKEMGLVYKTKDGGITKQLFKAAYSGQTNKEEQHEIVKLINEKYPNSIKNVVISGNEEPLFIHDSLAPFAKKEDIAINEDRSINAFFGESAMSGDLSGITFKDSDFCNYLILGEMKKVRNIEVSIGLSFLYALKKYGYEFSNDSLYYLDLNSTEDAQLNPSPFDTYKDELSPVMHYAFDSDEIIDSINALYDELMYRKEATKLRTREIKVPKLLIVNSFSFLNEIEENTPSYDYSDSYSESEESSEDDFGGNMAALEELDKECSNTPRSSNSSDLSLVDKLMCLYEKGFTYKIYVIIQDRHSSAFTKNYDFADFTKVICCDKGETENCSISEKGSSPTITELPAAYAIIYPDVSKVRPFVFDKSEKTKKIINNLVEVLTNE